MSNKVGVGCSHQPDAPLSPFQVPAIIFLFKLARDLTQPGPAHGSRGTLP